MLDALKETDLVDAVAVSDDQILAVGSRGRSAHFSEGRWKIVHPATDADLHALSARGERVIAVGARGVVLEWHGDVWSDLSSRFTDYDLTEAWLAPNGDIFAIGHDRTQPAGMAGATILHHTDNRWEREWLLDDSLGPGGELVGICGTEYGDVIAVGTAGITPDMLMVRYDGHTWHETISTDNGLPATCTSTNTAITLVDMEGLDVRRVIDNRMSYLDRSCPDSGCEPLQSSTVSATVDNQGRLIVVGDAIIEERSQALLLAENPAGTDLLDVHAIAGNGAIAVGVGGSIVRSDGTQWYADDSGTSETLRAVSSTTQYLVAVGDRGTVLVKLLNPDN